MTTTVNDIVQPDQDAISFTYDRGDLVITYEEVVPEGDLAKMLDNNCRGLVLDPPLVNGMVNVCWDDGERELVDPEFLYLVFRGPNGS